MSSRLSARRHGFTLIELLVVIAIIGVLVSLLLPAVQQAREAARRSQCKNNLKQIAMGLMNYESAYSVLPPGWVASQGLRYTGIGNTGTGVNGYGSWSWGAMVLPFIDQAPLYDSLRVGDDIRNALDDPTRLALMQQLYPIFRCPSDSGPTINDRRSFSGFAGIRRNLSTSNYVAWNSGSWGWLPGFSDEPSDRRGMFTMNSSTRFRDVRDGLSNTILLGERTYKGFQIIIPPATVCNENCNAAVIFANEWNNDFLTSRRNPVYGNTNTLGLGEGAINSVFTGNPTAPGNNCNPICARGAASFHTGGAQFALGDGSVRFISENIDWKPDIGITSVFERLGGIADGQPVGGEF